MALSRFPCRSLRWSIALWISTSLSILSMARVMVGDDPPEVADRVVITDPVEKEVFILSLEDEDKKPIVGAEARIYALRCKEDPGSHYGWPENNMGKSLALETDEHGKVSLPYPVRFGREPDWLTTTVLSISISHPEFVTVQVDVDPTQADFVQNLKAGCELTVSARDAQMRSTKTFGILMAGPGRGAKWITDESGMKRSRAIPDGNWQMLMASPQPDGATLFSGVIPVRLKARQEVRVRDVPLRKGLRIDGHLSENVTRPVSHGHVIAWCLPKPEDSTWGDTNPSIAWTEKTEIREDGSFTFASLPRTGRIQFIAICRGWVIEDSSSQPNGMVRGMTIDLDALESGDDTLDDLEISMLEAGSLEVKVLKPDGEPLVGASVSTWPNQLLDLGGSQILGDSYPSIDVIRGQIDPSNSEPKKNRELPERYFQKTDESGIALLRDIPLHHNYSFEVGHEKYQLPKAKTEDIRRWINFVCDGPEPRKVTVVTEAIEK